MCSPNCAKGYYEYSPAMSTETDIKDDSIQALLNDTDSELSSLSPLDAPNQSLYMIGGVCVAMFLVGVIIILLAVTISKLRKREEHSNSVHPADVVLQTAPAANPVVTQPSAPQALQPDPLAYRGQILWHYSPPPSQQYLYNNDQDNLVQNLNAERPGFVRGFRKNLGGRWRRLVKKKPQTDVYTIPAELKPQLKQIYVY
ncbi:uncharacterized protein LOC109594870 isoform X2 [Aethina tumida]|uniref:uncharacterized protein LOC109594870 isoform X2 n=1 Tax=Aethina tumida TaxID=116153 RepID=UPI00096AE3B3|nr:uncharacterized protein LOC109594870 isoform X2 [Aethina tumida]